MTIKEYLNAKLGALNLTDADYVNYSIENDIDIEDTYTASNQEEVNMGMIGLVESVLFSPRMSSINEGGFSMSWDFSELGKYYMWLCHKYAKTPKPDVAAMLGISMIIDRTHDW